LPTAQSSYQHMRFGPIFSPEPRLRLLHLRFTQSTSRQNIIQAEVGLRHLARLQLANVDYGLGTDRQTHQKCATEASAIPPTYDLSVLRMSGDYVIVLYGEITQG
jgi:hypothetical protein